MTSPRLSLVSTQTATTYSFRAAPGTFDWACCTVNDATGELLITSDWGNWSHRWNAHPEALGAPTLTVFIGDRGDVDYLARKLQNEGTGGVRFSGAATARALRQRLCERRLEDGREQLENRLEPDDMPDGAPLPHLSDRYDERGLPLFSDHYVDGPTWRDRRERLPYLSRDTARRIWNAIGAVAEDVGRSSDLFYERVQQIDGFTDYVTEEPWEYGETEQTPEDRALRDIVLPALIEACRARSAAGTTPATAPIAAGAAAARPDAPLRDAGVAIRPCTNNSPPGFSGHWREWHRGHGCDKDDGKARTPEAAAEIAGGVAR